MSTRNIYGTIEVNPLPEGFHDEEITGSVDWSDCRLVRVERLRLLSDPGYPAWDVSYCHGRLKDGSKVAVILPFSELPKRNMRGALLAHAKRDKVYAKGLGIFENISTLC
jgi:hypothetical protein